MVVLGTAILACGAASSIRAQGRAPQRAIAAIDTVRTLQEGRGRSVNSLEFMLETPDTAPPAGRLALAVVVRNTGATTAPFTHRIDGTVDFVVRTLSGRLVWRLLDRPAQDASIRDSIPPGQRRRFTSEWDLSDSTGARVAAGVYLVEARFYMNAYRARPAPPSSYPISLGPVRLIVR